jgi:type II secretory pathway pseudopilin PulG
MRHEKRQTFRDAWPASVLVRDAVAHAQDANQPLGTVPFVAGNRMPRGPAVRSGITLLELLIVMLILLMVTAAAIPVVAPAMRNREMREATRLVNSFIGAAKTRALATGRPCGVQIERFNGLPFAFQLSQIELPPPYSGDMLSARTVGVQTLAGEPGMNTKNRAGNWPYVLWFRVAMDPATFNRSLIRIYDTIQLGSQGHVYTVLGPDEDEDGVIDPPSSESSPIMLELAFLSNTPILNNVFFPWPVNTGSASDPMDAAALSVNVPYQVFRQPVRTSTPPMVLPGGIVIDLSISGVGDQLFNVTKYQDFSIGMPAVEPIVLFDPQILFSPSGRVEWVSGADGKLTRATDPVYLLIGRRELMFDVTNRVDAKNIVFQNLSPVPNPSDTMPPPAENFWVTIAPQTGQVTTAEVAPNFQDWENKTGALGGTTLQDVINLTLHGSATHGLTGARAFARDSIGLGGR